MNGLFWPSKVTLSRSSLFKFYTNSSQWTRKRFSMIKFAKAYAAETGKDAITPSSKGRKSWLRNASDPTKMRMDQISLSLAFIKSAFPLMMSRKQNTFMSALTHTRDALNLKIDLRSRWKSGRWRSGRIMVFRGGGSMIMQTKESFMDLFRPRCVYSLLMPDNKFCDEYSTLIGPPSPLMTQVWSTQTCITGGRSKITGSWSKSTKTAISSQGNQRLSRWLRPSLWR